jgi:hypothetical protein
MRKTLVLVFFWLLATGVAQAQPADSLSAAVKQAGKQMVWPPPPRPTPVDKHNWIRVLRLPNGSPIRVITHDGATRDGHLGDVNNDRIVLLAPSNLPPEAREALLDLAANYPGYIGRLRRFTHLKLEVADSGVFFDGIRIADVDAVFIEIPRDSIFEVKRPSRGSGPGALIGFVAGFNLGVRGALNLGFKQCGSSCNDERALALLSLTAIPLAATYLGARFIPHPAWTTAYRSRLRMGG